MSVIEVKGLKKNYRTRIKEEGIGGSLRALIKPAYRVVEAVNNVSFTVERGEIVAFIGPNGAGKSTTIKILTGILHPSAGTVSVLGFNPVTERTRLSYRIGTVFGQRSQLWFHLPPVDSFLLLGAIYDVESGTLRRRIQELTELFALGDLLQTPVRKLSLGQRIRCEVAASLLHSPEILFLDEPTIGLDVVVKHSIRELILRMNRELGTTVFLTSHDTGDVEHVCRRAIIIDQGKIVLDEAVKKLKYNYLNQKLITVRFEQPQPSFAVPEGITMLKAGSNAARLSVDTRVRSVDEVMRWLTDRGGVADLTVENPPLEETIAAIFKRREAVCREKLP